MSQCWPNVLHLAPVRKWSGDVRGLRSCRTRRSSGDEGEAGRLRRGASQSSLDESSQRPAPPSPAAPAHAAALLDALARLRRDGALCDVRLRALPQHDGVWAHRAVLAACSPYFRAMFTQFDERTQPTVTIQDVDPPALEAVVEYVYAPDSLRISEENVQAVLSAASLLQVCGARAACCGFLAGALAPDNALGIKAFAEMHGCADLAHAAHAFVDAHFVEVGAGRGPGPRGRRSAEGPHRPRPPVAGAGQRGVPGADGRGARAAARLRPHRRQYPPPPRRPARALRHPPSPFVVRRFRTRRWSSTPSCGGCSTIRRRGARRWVRCWSTCVCRCWRRTCWWPAPPPSRWPAPACASR